MRKRSNAYGEKPRYGPYYPKAERKTTEHLFFLSFAAEDFCLVIFLPGNILMLNSKMASTLFYTFLITFSPVGWFFLLDIV